MNYSPRSAVPLFILPRDSRCWRIQRLESYENGRELALVPCFSARSAARLGAGRHGSGGEGCDSDDGLEDSHSPSLISGRRLSAGLLGRVRLRSDYRRSQRVFRFLLQFDRTRRCLRAEPLGSARAEPSALRGTARGWASAGAPGRVRRSRGCPLPQEAPQEAPAL